MMEPTAGQMREWLKDQPDDAPVKFILGDQRLRVHEN